MPQEPSLARGVGKPQAPSINASGHPLLEYIDNLRVEHNYSCSTMSQIAGLSESYWVVALHKKTLERMLRALDSILEIFDLELSIKRIAKGD